MLGWIRRRIGSDCDIDHDYYYDYKRVTDRKVKELEDIVKLKDTTIKELARHNELAEKKISNLYENRTP